MDATNRQAELELDVGVADDILVVGIQCTAMGAGTPPDTVVASVVEESIAVAAVAARQT